MCALTLPQELQEKILNEYIFNTRADGVLAYAFRCNKEPIEKNQTYILGGMRILHRILIVRHVCTT